ncbi:hypothetical protein [Proteus cibi]|uniref:hypothetical protein n=1 Tax=Proteus cibi TaxID=2050966 RepID=UPI000D686870|nr:hypothetical protein [Proteus cibi]MBS6211829.1 hypothetical protein [Proteus hauseri]
MFKMFSPQAVEQQTQLLTFDICLHFFCGKICSGKSTLAKSFSKFPRTVLIRLEPQMQSLILLHSIFRTLIQKSD